MNLGWDTAPITSASVLPGEGGAETKARVKMLFADFIRDFRMGQDFIYRDSLQQNLQLSNRFIEVDLAHVSSYNEVLAGLLVERPAEYLELVRNKPRL